MALTTEQQTSHLSRLQQEILAWDYYRMGGEDDPGAAAGRTLLRLKRCGRRRMRRSASSDLRRGAGAGTLALASWW